MKTGQIQIILTINNTALSLIPFFLSSGFVKRVILITDDVKNKKNLFSKLPSLPNGSFWVLKVMIEESLEYSMTVIIQAKCKIYQLK